MSDLSTRLRDLISRTDLAAEPMRVSNAAKLLAEVQRWESQGESLRRQVAALEGAEGSPSSELGKSLADRAFEVLKDEGEAMRYREIAAVIKSRGFRHAREPKNPDKQLSDSVWTAMHEDTRFVKVGRGIFDLAERVGGES